MHTHTLLSFASKYTKNQKNEENRSLRSGGGGDGGSSHRSSSRGSSDLQPHGSELMCRCNHVVGGAYTDLLREVEGTTVMLLWVPKRSKVQTLCDISSRQSGCVHLPCCCPNLLETMLPIMQMEVGICECNPYYQIKL